MRRYEVSDGSSHKFWEVSLRGSTLHIRFGRIGSSGQQREKEFASFEEARAALDRAAGEKLGGGYKLVYDDDVGGGSAGAAGSVDPRNAELEAAILADPEDPTPYLVYGDWLQAQHDPRGELIPIQHALRGEKDPVRFLELRRAEQAIFKQHGDYLLGPLVPHLHRFKLDWRLGFIYSARLTLRSDDPEASGEPSWLELLELVLSVPSSRFMQELDPGASGLRDRESIWPRLTRLDLPPLRGLTFAGGEVSFGDLSPLLVALPGLRRLRLAGRARVPFQALSELRLLELTTNDPELIAGAVLSELPRLERLVLCVSNLSVEQLAPLLEGGRLPALRHLAMPSTHATDALCAALVRSRLARQLESLDLRGGRLTDEGAAVLAGARSALRSLKLLDVSYNLLSTKAVAQLAKLCDTVRATGQIDPRPADEDDDRYDESME